MTNSKIYIAFYKHKRPFNSLQNAYYRIVDDIIKLASGGKYSHCEVVTKLSDNEYECFSSSVRDKGVRRKIMDLPLDRWDLVEINNVSRADIVDFYLKTVGMGYDFIGCIGTKLPLRDSKTRYFCSEWCADLLKLPKPNKITPVDLYNILTKD